MSVSVEIRHAFDGFTLEAAFEAPAGVTALLGASGAGKTTIVNAVAGLFKPDHGRISVGETCLIDTTCSLVVPAHKRRIGYVFQDARLFPHLSVEQNLLYGQWFSGRTTSSDAFQHLVELLGIEHLRSRRPAALSGGERQRVAIGRALLSSPRMLLLDEPLAALDDARKADILPYLERLRDDLEIPILYVSHAVGEVARLATTIVAVDRGRVARVGPAPEILAAPDGLAILAGREAGSILAATVVAHDHGDGLSELAFSGGRLVVGLVDAAPGAQVRVRVHAQDVILALTPPDDTSALNMLAGTVHAIGDASGAIVDVTVRCGSDDVLARITRRSMRRLGLDVGLSCTVILKSLSVTKDDVGLGVGPSPTRGGLFR